MFTRRKQGEVDTTYTDTIIREFIEYMEYNKVQELEFQESIVVNDVKLYITGEDTNQNGKYFYHAGFITNTKTNKKELWDKQYCSMDLYNELWEKARDNVSKNKRRQIYGIC